MCQQNLSGSSMVTYQSMSVRYAMGHRALLQQAQQPALGFLSRAMQAGEARAWVHTPCIWWPCSEYLPGHLGEREAWHRVRSRPVVCQVYIILLYRVTSICYEGLQP